MAALVCVGRRGLSIFCRRNAAGCFAASRNFSTETKEANLQEEVDDRKDSWLKKLISSRKIDPSKVSHSQMLSDKDTVYEIQFHAVKPEYMESYLNGFQTFVDRVHAKQTGAELAGSWTVEIGDQDEAIHLWKFQGGYPVLNRAREIYRTDQEFLDFRVERNKMLRYRNNQILLPFSFWGPIKGREGKNIYELRSYVLKPGTMIEWGNNWARGIQFRQDKEEPVGGFFSNIGTLNEVHHIWAYESLQSRKEVREAAWRRPGWDECVAYTVPLIRSTKARILIPTPFSPMQ